MHTDQEDGNTGDNRFGIIIRNDKPGKCQKCKTFLTFAKVRVAAIIALLR